MLEVNNVCVSFRSERQEKLFGITRDQVLFDVSLKVPQGTCLGIVQGEPVVPLQDILYRLVLQQADLLSPPHSPAERLAPAGGRRPAADRPPPPR